MRDLILYSIVFSILPFALFRPVIGIYLYTWISLMNPHRLSYGSSYDFPFAAIIAITTILGLLISKQPKKFPFAPVTILLIIFMVWVTLTSFFALEPDLVWDGWSKSTKTLFITLVAIFAINTEKELKGFAWVVGLSLGFYGLKGGLFTLASGGTNQVLGPASSYISDNNTMALALITVIPIIWYLKLQAEKKWLSFGLTLLVVLTGIAAVGTYSRGALLAGVGMFFFLWLKSKQKWRVGIALILVIPLMYTFMPDKWFARMDTIDNYQEDASAMGRINGWHFATNVAKDNLMGGGFHVFTPKIFLRYAPDPLDYHVAHSIYFQVLGDHGFIGLSIFLLILIFAWRTGSRIIKFSHGKKELKWASDLAAMSQVSIVGYCIAGAFLSLPYYDLYYDILILLVLLEKIVLHKVEKFNLQSLPKT